MLISVSLTACGSPTNPLDSAPRLAHPPATLHDLTTLAASADPSAVDEINHGSRGFYPSTTSADVDCLKPHREVILRNGLSEQQAVSDLLGYFFHHSVENSCGSEVWVYHPFTGNQPRGPDAGSITLDVADGEQKLAIRLGVNEYDVTYTCASGLCLPGRLTTGTYTTQNFLPGMVLTVPSSGWSSGEDSAGEFNLHRVDNPTGTIHFWVDPHPIAKSTDPVEPGTVRVRGVPATPKGLIAWLEKDPDLIVSDPTVRTIAGGIQASYVDVDAALTVPPSDRHYYFDFGGIYGDNTPSPGYDFHYGSGRGERVRLYFASISSGSTAHLLVISVYAHDPATFASLVASAQPFLDSLHLPADLPTRPR